MVNTYTKGKLNNQEGRGTNLFLWISTSTSLEALSFDLEPLEYLDSLDYLDLLEYLGKPRESRVSSTSSYPRKERRDEQ